MMKRVLVISDNLELASFFMAESNLDSVKRLAEFDFCYSAINKNPDGLIKLGLYPLDIKNEEVVNDLIERFDLIISAHCKQIFPKKIVSNVLCVNVHPGFNPFNRGWYPQVFSIINKMPIGATIHVMDEHVDHGDVIDQAKVCIKPSDTSKDVYERVIGVEKELVKKNLASILSGEFTRKSLEQKGNYNSISDFKSLCKLDMQHVGTLQEHIDLLRALSHGDFKNAFFENDGKKIFVKIQLASNCED